MSTFGSPGGRQPAGKPTPPERGSFPLDHGGGGGGVGECKAIMTQYLRCLRLHRGTNDNECRIISKEYLQCRMEHNLMAPDEMKNLGYAEGQIASTSSASTAPTATQTTTLRSSQQPGGGSAR
ncbi:CHCH domain-containing protein [Cryomyces antarcticus]